MVIRILSKKLLLGCVSVRTRYQYFHASAASFKIVQFLLSDIGEGIREVTVSEWFVKEGDKVSQFDDICCVESDKASVNITSRYDGVIKKIYHSIGDKALVGKPLVDIDTDEAESETSSDELALEESVSLKEEEKISMGAGLPEKEANTDGILFVKALATPAVRRIAMEYNVALSSVIGTGKAGRILKEDILNHLKVTPPPNEKPQQRSPLLPSTDQSASSNNIIPITGIKRVMFNTMTQSNLIPSFNLFEEVNMSKLIALKKDVQQHTEDKKIRLTLMPFFMKSLSKSLIEFPLLNSSLDDTNENLILNNCHNIGFAVDTKNGLIVPNVKNVQLLNIVEIAKEMNRILEKGKEGFFNPSDLKGGSITISNIGMIGGTYARPLILPPEVAIVALGKITKKPTFNKDGELTSSDILYSSWTADHRVIDGATLTRFVSLWKYYLENPAVLALDI